jgi:hypothetical protein
LIEIIDHLFLRSGGDSQQLQLKMLLRLDYAKMKYMETRFSKGMTRLQQARPG